MLINTVILFLQNALPIFIVTTLLLINLSSEMALTLRPKIIGLGLILTSASIIILSENLKFLSQLIDGKGLEIFTSVGGLIVYFSCVGLFFMNKVSHSLYAKKKLAFIVFFMICSANGANFITYLTHYWTQAEQLESMIIGVILGSGICVSISILLYFLLRSADHKINHNVSNYFLLFFATGQLMKSIVLLQQVDFISSNQPFWDTSSVIIESSEVGQLLIVLFGYESTPSSLQVVLYVLAIVIPVVAPKLRYIYCFSLGKKL